MNLKELGNHNNELRKQLNEENKKYYEELLTVARLHTGNHSEKELEIILLDILQDLILYQKEGKNYVDIYGEDITGFAKSIISNLPKEKDNKKRMRFLLVYALILLIFSFLPNALLSKNEIEPVLMMLSYAFSLVGIISCIYLIFYKKTNKNRWLIYISSLIIFECSIFLVPILHLLKVFGPSVTFKVSLPENFAYYYAIFVIVAGFYIYTTFKKYYSKNI